MNNILEIAEVVNKNLHKEYAPKEVYPVSLKGDLKDETDEEKLEAILKGLKWLFKKLDKYSDICLSHIIKGSEIIDEDTIKITLSAASYARGGSYSYPVKGDMIEFENGVLGFISNKNSENIYEHSFIIKKANKAEIMNIAEGAKEGTKIKILT